MAAATAFDILRESSPVVSVGILTADLLSLGSELALLERSGVKVAHVGVMDGCFCPMMTVGPPFIKALKTPLLKDVHLMIDEPLNKVVDYVAAGADIITIHPEACSHVHRVLQQMRMMKNANNPERGLVRGVDLIVTGSAVFDGKAAEANARFMLEAVKKGVRCQVSGVRRQ